MLKKSIITIICAAMPASTYVGATSSLNLSYTAPEVEINEASTNQNDELQFPKKYRMVGIAKKPKLC